MKTSITLFLTAILFLACSKSEEDAPAKVSMLSKVTEKEMTTGDIILSNSYSYDDQKRLIAVKFSAGENTFKYEAGKITLTQTFTGVPTLKTIFFYNEKGMVKEEFYSNTTLEKTGTWKNRTDGGKEIAYTKPNGDAIETKYIRYSDSGNIERVAVDVAGGTQFDYEMVYEDFDSGKRHLFAPYRDAIGNLIMEANIPGLNPPNNPSKYKRTLTATSTATISERYEYKYNQYRQVTEVKIYNLLDNGKHFSTMTFEYQEF